jgi:hypothetical protein
MPIGNGLRKLGSDVNSFQLSERYSHLPPLPSDSHKYFTDLMPFVVEQANDFDLLSAFQRRNRRRGNAERIKRKLQLFFEIAVPPAESLGFVVAVHDDFVPFMTSLWCGFCHTRNFRAPAFVLASK